MASAKPVPDKGNSPVALLVLGMHRSGTSAVARVLNLLGAELGDDLMPAAPDNPSGFWEHNGIVAVHDTLLKALGLRWDDPRPLPSNWLRSAAAGHAERELKNLIRRDFTGVDLWAIKDPRLCRLMPLWRRVLASLAIEPRVLLVSRHPSEVAESLHQRDRLPQPIGEFLWARYLLEAVKGSAGCRRSMIDYADLLADWRQVVERIDQALSLGLKVDARRVREVQAFLRPQLRHHAAHGAWPGGPLAPLGEIAGGTLDAKAVDGAARAFDAVMRPTQPLVEAYASLVAVARGNEAKIRTDLEAQGHWAQQLDGELHAVRARHGQLVAEHEHTVGWAHALQSELATLQGLYRQAEADRDEKAGWAQNVQDELARLQGLYRQAEADRDEKTGWAQSLQGELARLQGLYRQAEADREEKTGWAQSLQGELATLQGLYRQAEADREEKTGWARALNAELAQLRLEHDRVAADHFEKQDRLQALEISFNESKGREDALRERIARKEQQEQEMQLQLERIAAELARLQNALSDRQAELESERATRHVFQQYASELEQAVGGILSSSSWRWSRPLRRLMAALRGSAVEVALPQRPHPFLATALRWQEPSARVAPDQPHQTGEPAAGVFAGIAFPEVDGPRVTVVIPTYGKPDYTARCLLSIQRSGDVASFEVLLLEDASGDGAMEALRAIPGLRYHENKENLGFLRSCNQALQLARGEFICLLNNDTEVQPGWLDALLRTFDTHPDAGLVGAKLVYPDGRLQEAGGIVWSDATAWNYGRLQDPAAPEFCYAKEVDYVSGACIMLPAGLFRRLGGFDEFYCPAYCEDTDLAFRVRAVGQRVMMQPEAVVIHHEGISHGTDEATGVKAWQVVNQGKFRERWAQTLQHEHFRNAEHPFLARDRSALKKTVLVIDHYVPQPDRDAGSRTMWQFMQLFLAHGMNVKFWPENLWRDPVYTQRLQQAGVEVMYGPAWANGFERWLEQADGAIDYVLLSRPHVTQPLLQALRRRTRAKLLYYGHDIHHLRILSEYALTGDKALLPEAERLRALEEAVWRSVDVAYYPADAETNHVRTWLTANNVNSLAATIPVYAFDSFPEDPWNNLDERRDVLFVAGFAHGPNADAAAWLVNEVMPRLWRRHPRLRLSLVGSNPTSAVVALASERVEVTGFVDDDELQRRYRSARVAVAPLRYGGGMKGKVVEAMRFGLPCVTTPIGKQGLEDVDDWLAAHQDPDAFADAVFRLLEDDAAWQHASVSSQAHARRHFSSEAMWQVVGRAIDPAPYESADVRRVQLRGAA